MKMIIESKNQVIEPFENDFTRSQDNKKRKITRNFLTIFFLSLFWFLFRSGTKPSRAYYPCQQTALDTVNQSLSSIGTSLITFFGILLQIFFFRSRKNILLVTVLFTSVLTFSYLTTDNNLILNNVNRSNQQVSLVLDSHNATLFPASDIYIVNGPTRANVSNLITLMGNNSLFFYQSSEQGLNQGANGLIAKNDVVIIKINCQWNQRGGTNTDIIQELIQLIIDHPDGFLGEIVVADNGQVRGNFDYSSNNAEDQSQSVQDVVDLFSSEHDVSVYDWQNIRGNEVEEFSNADMNNGYIDFNIPDPETGFNVTYPKFTTIYGTHVSLKHGIWNNSHYEDCLKVINLPVLKTHGQFDVTGATKHYMGVQSEEEYNNQGGLGNGHNTIADGGMGTLLAELGLPTLNIIDAIWVNANPSGSGLNGPFTSYDRATKINILMSSVDPIAIDFYAAKFVLQETAKELGYTDTSSIDPHTIISWKESFGEWLNNSRDELIREGFQVTSHENQMNVYVNQLLNNQQSSSDSNPSSSSSPTTGSVAFGFSIIYMPILIILVRWLRKKDKLT